MGGGGQCPGFQGVCSMKCLRLPPRTLVSFPSGSRTWRSVPSFSPQTAVFAATLLAIVLFGSVGVSAQQQIGHVIVIFQENRTPDNLFQGLPNADIATSGTGKKGK